jgi:hypothetical protein
MVKLAMGLNIVNFDEERKAIFKKLGELDWYKKTSQEIKGELKNLPDEFEGFLKDLGDRPETVGNVEVIKMVKLNHGHYLVNPVFEVRSNLTNEIFTFEYSSWKYGKETGCKGVILVEVDDKIEYLLVKKTNKFAVAKNLFEALGGFYTHFKDDKLVSLSKKIEEQIKRIVKIEELTIKKYIELGDFFPDAGLSNQRVSLFGAIVELENKESVVDYFENKKIGGGRINFEVEMWPVEKMADLIKESEDGYLLACLARLGANGII